jgi:hypothetical protein
MLECALAGEGAVGTCRASCARYAPIWRENVGGSSARPGSHQIWKHPLLPGEEVNLAGNDGADAHRYQERDVREAVTRAREARGRQQP